MFRTCLHVHSRRRSCRRTTYLSPCLVPATVAVAKLGIRSIDSHLGEQLDGSVLISISVADAIRESVIPESFGFPC